MLNPDEDDHIKLHDDVNHYVQMTLNQSISDGDYYKSRTNVFCSSRALLKKEWNRVIKFWLRRFFWHVCRSVSAHATMIRGKARGTE